MFCSEEMMPEPSLEGLTGTSPGRGGRHGSVICGRSLLQASLFWKPALLVQLPPCHWGSLLHHHLVSGSGYFPVG